MIEPGVLECAKVEELAAGYVRDELDRAEMTGVRAHLGTCNDDHAEFADLAAAASLCWLSPIEPPVELKQRILASIECEIAEQSKRRPQRRRIGVADFPARLGPDI